MTAVDHLRAWTKSSVRKAVRAAGYELVPAATGFGALRMRLLSDIPVVADIGANVGQYAERIFDSGYTGFVHSFEPSSAAFEVLAAKARQRPAWQAHQVALGPGAGLGILNVSENSVSSSLLEVGALHLRAAPRSRTAYTESVPISTLDAELLSAMDGPFFLKLDVQGYEAEVLAGAPETLAQTNAIQIEVSFDDLYKGQADWIALASELAARGFHLRYIEPGYEDKSTGFMLQADFLFVRESDSQ